MSAKIDAYDCPGCKAMTGLWKIDYRDGAVQCPDCGYTCYPDELDPNDEY